MKLSPPSAKQRAGISLSIQPWLLGLGLFTLLPATTARAFTTTANTNVTVLVSDYGYNPEHRKIVNYRGTNAVNSFTVKRAADGATVFTGPLAPVTGDFGACEQGDFSSVRTEGEYFIQIGNETSFRTFRIRPHLWDNLQQLSAWYYFGLRRIGEDNVMGNLGDCDGTHWDDARYNPAYGTGYRYIGTAWGDGDDFRIYPSASLVVAQYCALKETRPFWDNNDWIYSQVRWGLDGTLSFLDEDGLLRMALSGTDSLSDHKFYTGDEKELGDAFNQNWTVNEYHETENHEQVYSELLIGPAYAVYLFRGKDPEFFERVEALVKLGYSKLYRQYQPYPQKYSLGSWIWLNVMMWKMTDETIYRERAIAEADRLMALQQTNFAGNGMIHARGWYLRDTRSTRNPWGEKPEQEVMVTPWSYQGLLKLIEYLPRDRHYPKWTNSVAMYAKDYLQAVAGRNAFGYTPMKVEATNGASLKRRQGDLNYQYFGSIGRHFQQVGNAAFMLSAGKLLKDSSLQAAAWQQVFWFAGNNPAGLGLIYGLGDNLNEQQYSHDTMGRAFPGGLSNGAVGNSKDDPDFGQYNEYYTYANLQVLWLATVIGAHQFDEPILLWPKEIGEAACGRHPEANAGHHFPVRLKGGFTYHFTAVVRDDPRNRVTWSVNGIAGGSASAGTISNRGTYTAPFVTMETNVTIRAASRVNPKVWDETKVTLYPVPGMVMNLSWATPNGRDVALNWSALSTNCAGYTIWQRTPVTAQQVGTIFKRIAATSSTGITIPGPIPAGTEFLVKGYNYQITNSRVTKVYGYGPASAAVKFAGTGNRK